MSSLNVVVLVCGCVNCLYWWQFWGGDVGSLPTQLKMYLQLRHSLQVVLIIFILLYCIKIYHSCAPSRPTVHFKKTSSLGQVCIVVRGHRTSQGKSASNFRTRPEVKSIKNALGLYFCIRVELLLELFRTGRDNEGGQPRSQEVR